MRAAILVAALTLAACKPSEETRLKVIIGATLIDGSGGPPMSRSVIIVAGSRVRATGTQAATPIPAGSDKFDGSGRFAAPLPVTLSENFRIPEVSNLAEMRRKVDDGVNVLAGVPADTEEFDAALLQKLRNLRVVFFPRLARLSPGESLDRARRNTKRLAAAGILIAAAGDSAREWELLAEAGLSPMEILLAVTRNAAAGVGKGEEAGLIAPGRPANLVLLSANPLEDARNLAKAEKVMRDGEWVSH